MKIHPALILAASIASLLPVRADAAVILWDGGGGTLFWGNAENWSTNSVPGTADIAHFSGTSPFYVIVDGNRSFQSLWLSGDSDYTINGNSLTLSDSLFGLYVNSPISGTVRHTITSHVSMTGSSAPLLIGSNATLHVSSSFTTTGLLDKLNGGTAILSTAVTAGGGVRVQDGTLQIGDGGTTGTLSGNVELTSSSATLVFNRGGSSTYAGVISGTSGTVTKDGTGTLILTGVNTHTGTLRINGGNLSLGGGVSSGTWAGNISNAGTVIFNQTTDQTYSGVISDFGGIFKAGGNILTLSGSSTYSGTTHIEGGTLAFSSSANLGAGGITFNGGTLKWLSGNGHDISARAVTISSGGATLDTGANNVTFNAGIGNGGTGALTKQGTGMLRLNGGGNFSGGANLVEGTLALGHSSGLGSTGTISFSGGTLSYPSSSVTNDLSSRFSSAAGQAYKVDVGSGISVNFGSALLSSGDSFTKTGEGTLNLSAGGWTIDSGLTVNGGLLNLGATTDISVSGGIAVASGATLGIRPNTDRAFAGTLSGTGTVELHNHFISFTGSGNSFTGTFGFGNSTADLVLGNGGSGGIVDATITTIDSANSVTFDSSSNFTHTKVISGPGSLIKSGSGTLTLTGANSLSGAVTVSAGTLKVGDGGTTGSIENVASIAVGSGATFAWDRADDAAFYLPVSGAGGVTKEGAGYLATNLNLTYTGPTVVSEGVLQIGGGGTAGSLSSSTAIHIASGAIIKYFRSDEAVVSNVFTGSGAIHNTGNGNTVLTGTSNSFSGIVNAVQGTMTIGNGGTAGSIPAASKYYAFGGADFTVSRSGAVSISAAIDGAGDFYFDSGGSFTLSGAVTSTGMFTVSDSTVTLTGGASRSFNSLVLAYGSGFTLGPNTAATASTITLGNNASGGTDTVTIGTGASLTTSGTVTLGNTNGTSAVVNVAGGTWRAAGSVGPNTATSAPAAINVTAGGTLFLASGLAGGTATTLTLDNGTLGLTASTSSTSNLAIGSAGATVDTSGVDYFVRGALSGSGTLTKTGSGSLVLSGTSTLTGGLMISGGSVVVGETGTSGQLPAGAIVNNFKLGFARSDTMTVSQAISGTGEVTQLGSGTLIFTADHSYTGGTTISAGTLQLGNGGASGSVTGDIVNNSALVINRSAGLDLSGSISGTGSLTKTGAATVRLGGANTFSGGITIDAGALAIGTGGATGSITSDVVNNATLIFNRTTGYSYSGAISGTGGVFKVNSNTLTLSGANTYGGTTHLEGGTVVFSALSNMGSGGTIRLSGGELEWAGGTTTDISSRTVRIDAGGATFDTNGNDVTFANAIGNNGTGALTKTGAGVLTLAGDNTYSGPTTISGGSLLVNGSISGTTTVQSGGILGGTGTVGELTVQSGGTIAPGTSAGTLNTGNLSFSSGSTLFLEFNGTSAGTYDRLNVTGSVSFASATLSLSVGATLTAGSILFPIVNDGSDAISGTFLGLADDTFFAMGSTTFQISYDGNSATGLSTGGNDVALVVVPEPGSAALLLAGMSALFGLRRRR